MTADRRILDFSRFRADRRRVCEAIVAFLDEQYEPAPTEAIAVAIGVTRANLVQRYLAPLAVAGRVLRVAEPSRFEGGASSLWVAGPAPAGWES